MYRRRALICLGILLTLVLLTHALIARVRSSPLYLAEAKFAQIQTGMTLQQVDDLLGTRCYMMTAPSDAIHWTMIHREENSCTVTVRFEPQSSVHLTTNQDGEFIYAPTAKDKSLESSFTWLERATLYLGH